MELDSQERGQALPPILLLNPLGLTFQDLVCEDKDFRFNDRDASKGEIYSIHQMTLTSWKTTEVK